MEEQAWLIEIPTDEGAKWYTVNSNFTNDADEALRLCRKVDAEAAMEMLGFLNLMQWQRNIFLFFSDTPQEGRRK